MSTQTFDPIQYKAKLLQESDAAAAGWRKWWPTIERSAQPVSDRLVELAAIQPGSRVLDVATGIGEPAVTAARRVGPTGRVVATDFSPQMIAIGRERAAEFGLENIEFHVMDAEALEFPESSFDAVLCRWGLMFLPDLMSALQRIKQLLVPGGRLAASVAAEPAKYQLLSLPMRVIREKLDKPLPPPGIPGIFNLADETKLAQALRESGFHDIHTERLALAAEFPSAEAYTQFIQDVSTPIAALLAGQPAERQAEVWAALTEAARRFAAEDGTVRIPFEPILAIGQR